MTEPARLIADGRYQLQAVLGEGGMAVVYRAFDTRLQVERAIKVLAPAVARQAHVRARFETEARTMAALSHPNIISVHDIGQDGELIYMVMELLEGGSLWDWVHCFGPMPPRLALQAVLPVLPAVAAAHEAGIVHRDIKPHNIMLTADGVPRLADFGIAHVQDPLANRNLTRTGSVIGTWGYMAPEQRHSARTVDERSDVYALGATLYAISTGEVPVDLFASDEADEVLAVLPAPLAELIRGATSYRPDDRYPNPAAMARAVEAAVEVLPENPIGTPRLGELPPEVQRGMPMDSGFSAPWSRSELGMDDLRDLRHTSETRSDTFDIPQLSRDAVRGRWALSGFGVDPRPLDPALAAEPAAVDVSAITPPAPRHRGWALLPRSRSRLAVELTGMLIIVGLGGWLLPRILDSRDPAPVVEGPGPLEEVHARLTIEHPETEPQPPPRTEEIENITPPVVEPEAVENTTPPVVEPEVVENTPPPVVEPEVIEDLTPPPEVEPEESPPVPAIVSATGQAVEVYLEDDAGRRHELGSVPPGTYRVMASFPGTPTGEAAVGLELVAGGQVELVCDSRFEKCRAEPPPGI